MDKRTGFTLVELLVVIAIIAMLMAILMPALARVRKQAADVTCLSTLNQWGKVFMMYTVDNDGYFATGSTGKMWITVLKPYFKQSELLLCPLAKLPAVPAGSPMPWGGKFLAWGAFDAVYAPLGLQGVYGSYGMNGHCSNPTVGVPDPWGGDIEKYWRGPAAPGADNIPLFLDCTWLGARPEPSDQPPQFDGDHKYGPGIPGMKAFCLDRHNGGVNCLFVSLSARKVGLKELWKLKWHQKYDKSAGPTVWPDWMKNFKDY